MLLLSIYMVRIWRDKGVARRLVAVRDNELGAAAMGIPILRTKLLAFGLSGFMAGYAGVCFAFATQQLNNTDITFDPTTSFVIISMVVIGGLGSIPGAILGALYLEGLPAIFGANQTIQFITSGLGPDRVHPLPARRPGRAAAPLRRPGGHRDPRRAGADGRAAGRAPGGALGQRARHGGAHARRRRSRAVTTGAASQAAAPSAHPAHLERGRACSVHFGGVHALDGVTFEAEPGAIVGLIGANGSGKTTTLDVISGLVAPQAGTVRLDGIDLAEYLPEERLGIGMVRSFQDCRLYPELTVLDVLLLCEDARAEVAVLPTTLRLPWARRAERRKLEAVDQVIAAFGLERFRHHRTAELSTGTRRVVDLASIVLARPRLLLLDEPTAGIAQREAEAFIPLLRRLHAVADTTIVLVEHDVPAGLRAVLPGRGHGAGPGGGRRPPRRDPR